MKQENQVSLKFYYIVLIIIGIAMLITIIVHEAYADSPKKHISIILSDTCLRSKLCPNYKELADTLDNSNRELSGDFYQDKKGFWKRDKPMMKGAYEFYNNNITPQTIFVDPDEYTRLRTKLIIIESQLPIYLDKESNSIKNGTHITYHNRKIDVCQSATMGWQKGGYDLLLDTVNYFMSDCSATLKYTDKKVTYKQMIIKDKCTANCKYLKWLEEAKEKSKKFLVQPNKKLTNNTSTCKFERGEQICSK